MLSDAKDPSSSDNLFAELAKCVVGQSEYSFNVLYFLSLIESKQLMSKEKIARQTQEIESIRKQMLVS